MGLTTKEMPRRAPGQWNTVNASCYCCLATAMRASARARASELLVSGGVLGLFDVLQGTVAGGFGAGYIDVFGEFGGLGKDGDLVAKNFGKAPGHGETGGDAASV